MRHNHFKRSTIEAKKKEWKAFVSRIPAPPESYSEPRGIVMCAGGFCYLTCAWVSIRALRKHGCDLPIELWHFDDERNDQVQRELQKYNVECRSIGKAPHHVRGYFAKPLAILNSRFRQVLFLDADNVCTRDPTFLFDCEEFLRTGAVFWPDHWKTEKTNPIWRVIETDGCDEFEQESGQILVDKLRCWQPLNLCYYFNLNADFYYNLLLGDKDTFRFAWRALAVPYCMVDREVGQCGFVDSKNGFRNTTMVQHGFDGSVLFLHRNRLKWDITRPSEYAWMELRGFPKSARRREYFWGANGLELRGDIETKAAQPLFGNLEDDCLKFLEELRASPFYNQFMCQCYIRLFRLNECET